MSMSDSHSCIVCGTQRPVVAMEKARMADEISLRRRFFESRFEGQIKEEELKDITDFVQNTPADILQCSGCGLLSRQGSHQSDLVNRYVNDKYSGPVMELLFQRYVHAFRQRETPFRSLLESGARVLEVGSHVGGFLKVATEWGWRAEGVDVGVDVAAFASSKKLTTRCCQLEELSLSDKSKDAVFVWNCFEQLPDPLGSLQFISRILADRGHLIIRTPNALFFAFCQSMLDIERALGRPVEPDHVAIKMLAHNSFLGCPFSRLFCLSNLRQLLLRSGFGIDSVLPSHLIGVSGDYTSSMACKEEEGIAASLAKSGDRMARMDAQLVVSPWLEVICSRTLGEENKNVA